MDPQPARAKIKGLDTNNTWLFEHMVIAFWHGFGISNGLSIKKEDVETIHYKEGPSGYRVKPEVMRARLKEYLNWLERYQEKWNGELFMDMDEQARAIREKMDDPEHGWGDIVHMIELLQV